MDCSHRSITFMTLLFFALVNLIMAILNVTTEFFASAEARLITGWIILALGVILLLLGLLSALFYWKNKCGKSKRANAGASSDWLELDEEDGDQPTIKQVI
jgi:Zn-dependent protease with chaperone function